MLNNPYQQYQKTQAETASKGRLVVMLYQGAIKFVNKAMLSIDRKDFAEAHASALRAQDIILELQSTLNPDAGDVARNLDRIYQYAVDRIVEGNIRKDVKPLEEVASLLHELLPAWEEAVRITERDNTVVNAIGKVHTSALQPAAR